jgi:hypothetical protein
MMVGAGQSSGRNRMDGHVDRVHPDFAEHPANYDPFYTGRGYGGPR